MIFDVTIPFEMPRNGYLISTDRRVQAEFWEEVDKYDEGLSKAIGCYIFSIRAGKGIIPWYVGMAARQSFRKECFAPHKINKYNDSLNGRKGTPVLTFIPRLTPSYKFCPINKNGLSDIEYVEKLIIGYAIKRNTGLVNIKDTKILKELRLPGVLNSERGRDSAEVKSLKQILGL